MLKSFDFVDPNLAQKIKTLEQQLQRLEGSRRSLMEDTKILPSTRSKLMKYQSECEDNTRKLLSDEKNKLVDYLDKQTTVVSKDNRQTNQRHSHKNSVGLNQSTRVDLSIDDSKSFEGTSHSEHYKKINSFYIQEGKYQIGQVNSKQKGGNQHRVTVRRLKRKVGKQQKLIDMLVTWVKIYYQREAEGVENSSYDMSKENKLLRQETVDLQSRCKRLQDELNYLRQSFKNTSIDILEDHRKCQKVRNQNSELQLQRKELLQSARSLSKHQNSPCQHTLVRTNKRS